MVLEKVIFLKLLDIKLESNNFELFTLDKFTFEVVFQFTDDEIKIFTELFVLKMIHMLSGRTFVYFKNINELVEYTIQKYSIIGIKLNTANNVQYYTREIYFDDIQSYMCYINNRVHIDTMLNNIISLTSESIGILQNLISLSIIHVKPYHDENINDCVDNILDRRSFGFGVGNFSGISNTWIEKYMVCGKIQIIDKNIDEQCININNAINNNEHRWMKIMSEFKKLFDEFDLSLFAKYIVIKTNSCIDKYDIDITHIKIFLKSNYDININNWDYNNYFNNLNINSFFRNLSRKRYYIDGIFQYVSMEKYEIFNQILCDNSDRFNYSKNI